MKLNYDKVYYKQTNGDKVRILLNEFVAKGEDYALVEVEENEFKSVIAMQNAIMKQIKLGDYKIKTSRRGNNVWLVKEEKGV